MTESTLTVDVSHRPADRAGLAGSALAERAQRLLADRARAARWTRHRRWIAIAGGLGMLLLLASLAALRFDIAATHKAQQFAALIAACGVLLLATALLLGWHGSASERQLHRLALLRSNLDSTEAAAEVMRLRARIALALEQCKAMPPDTRGDVALEMLAALHDLDALDPLSGGSLPSETIERLTALGVQREALDRLAEGAPPPGADPSDAARTASRAA